jgi:aquaporin Z
MFGKNKAAALVAEFLGTGVLTLLIFSVQRSQLGLQYFVAIAAGLTIAVMTFVGDDASGAHFNPALTIGLWTARKLPTIRAIAYIIVQFAGAFAARGIYRYYSGTHLTNVGGKYSGKILIAEAVGTGVFAFIYASTLYRGRRESINPGTRAIFAGLAYTVGVLIASSAALGLLNPAVAAGLKSWVWFTYGLGPVIGGILGINLYTSLYAGSGTEVEEVIALETVTVTATANKPRSTTKKVATKRVATTTKRRTSSTRKR